MNFWPSRHVRRSSRKSSADCKRVLRVIASLIRVLLEVPGVAPDGLPREEYAEWPQLKGDGALPPVRIE